MTLGALRKTRAAARRRLGSLPPQRTRGILALALVSLALVAVGGATARSGAQTSPGPAPGVSQPAQTEATPWPTPTRQPTPTFVPEPPPPQFVPAGWQIYRDHHFAVAFPAGWVAYEHDVQRPDGGFEAVSVSLESPDDDQSIGISEHEALDAATLQQFCAEVGTRMSYAGLPVITSRISSTLRMFVFVSAGGSTGGVVYTLLYSEENTPLQVKWLYDSILATFRPEFSATACR